MRIESDKNNATLAAKLEQAQAEVAELKRSVERSQITLDQERKKLSERSEELRRLELALRASQRVAHLGSWAWHIQANRLEWSNEMFQIFGIDPEGFSGDLAAVVASAIHPDDRESVERSNRSVVEEGKPIPLEYRVIHSDGTIRFVWAEAGEMVRDADGRPERLTGIVQDVSRWRELVDALRMNEERHRRLVEAIPGILYTYSDKLGGSYYSPQVEEILGYAAEHLQKHPMLWHDSIHADDLPAVHRAIAAGSSNGSEVEYRIRDARGDWHWFLDRFVRVMREDGETTIEGLVVDITARKRAEDEGRTLSRAVDQSQSSIVITDRAGNIEYVNPRFEQVTGYTRAEALGKNPRILKSEMTPHETYIELWKVISEGGEWRGELCNRRKNGELFWEFAVISGLKDEDGGVAHYIAVKEEITEQRRAEEKRFKLETLLHQAQKMESVGRLAGGVAHDFNNMLSVILAHADLALESLDPSQVLHEDLVEIRNAARRSADLTRQLLAFARKQTVAPRVLDLNDTVAGMLKMLQRLLGENVKVTWLPCAGVWPIMIDPSQVDQLLANLCVNARDAIANVGNLTIETENQHFSDEDCASRVGFIPGDYVKLVVRDDGCGMDEETVSHVYEPFFTTKQVGTGTGLGLATVYGIVQQNLGVIEIRSEPGKGTTFTIYLPRHASGADSTRGSTVAPVVLGHETILLVEDEPAMLRVTRQMLMRLGYTVLAASSPVEAERLARENDDIRLLLTDVIMPEMNGRELAKSLLATRPRIKSLFMSGFTSDVIAQHGVAEDGVSFIQKPFSKEELAYKVRTTLDREPSLTRPPCG